MSLDKVCLHGAFPTKFWKIKDIFFQRNRNYTFKAIKVIFLIICEVHASCYFHDKSEVGRLKLILCVGEANCSQLADTERHFDLPKIRTIIKSHIVVCSRLAGNLTVAIVLREVVAHAEHK